MTFLSMKKTDENNLPFLPNASIAITKYNTRKIHLVDSGY